MKGILDENTVRKVFLYTAAIEKSKRKEVRFYESKPSIRSLSMYSLHCMYVCPYVCQMYSFLCRTSIVKSIVMAACSCISPHILAWRQRSLSNSFASIWCVYEYTWIEDAVWVKQASTHTQHTQTTERERERERDFL